MTHATVLAAGFPPIHPLFVNFTAALVPASFAFEAAGAIWRRDSLRAAASWALLFAACITPLTVLFGWLWFASMHEAPGWRMVYHQWLGTALGVLLIPAAIWRGRLFARSRKPGLLYALFALVLLTGIAAQGDLGASMSFHWGVVIPGEPRNHAKGNRDRSSTPVRPSPIRPLARASRPLTSRSSTDS